MQSECYQIKRNEILFQNLDNIDLYQFFISWTTGFKPGSFHFRVFCEALSKQIQKCSYKLHHAFLLFVFRRAWVDFREHWNIMILLKLFVTFQFALNSDTVTDTGPKEVSAEISSLNIYLILCFCTPWSFVGNGVGLYLFLPSTTDRTWSAAHWPFDHQII